MRRFTLERDEDIAGISGTGRVAEGIQWTDGTLAIRWLGVTPSLVYWNSLEDAYAVHAHGGRTRFEWLDQ